MKFNITKINDMLSQFEHNTNKVSTGQKFKYKLVISGDNFENYTFRDISIGDIFDAETLITDYQCWQYAFDFLDEVAKVCNVYCENGVEFGDSIGYTKTYVHDHDTIRVELLVVD